MSKINELTIFDNKEFGQIRAIEIDNEPWFVGKDIATSLGYKNTKDALSTHVEDCDKIMGSKNATPPIKDSMGRDQYPTWINESGLYALIFGSKLKKASQFKHWVTSEVLPSIRKHGMYAKEELLDNPDLLISIAQELKNEREKNKNLQSEKKILEIESVEMSKTISELKPKADYVDKILRSRSTVTVTQIAQDYGMSAKKFNKMLHNYGIQRNVGGQWILYAKYQGKGYVHSKAVDITRSNGQKDVVMNTEWTRRGMLFLYEELKKHEIYPLIERGNTNE